MGSATPADSRRLLSRGAADTVDDHLISSCRLAARVGAAGTLCLCLLALIGWIAGIPALTSWVPSRGSMSVATALGCTLASACILCEDLAVSTEGLGRWIVRGGGGIITAMGLYALVSYFAGGEATGGYIFGPHLGQVAPATALSLILFGVVLLSEHRLRGFLGSGVAALGLMTSFIALTGYAFNVDTFRRVWVYAAMALPTAVAFTLLFCSILLLRPRDGWMAYLSGADPGGVAARRLVPPVIAVPFAISLVALRFHEPGPLATEFSFAWMTVAIVVVLAVSVCAVSAWLSRTAAALEAAERTVRIGAQRFRQVIESSADAVIAKDLDGVVTSWNKAAERIFGYSASEMVGQPIARLLPADRLDEENGILARLRRGEQVDHFETVRRRKDGSEFPVSLTISPILGPGDKIIGASKIARDITERNRMVEEIRAGGDRFRSIFSAVSEGIFIVSAMGSFLEVNETGCTMLGYTSSELVGGDIQMISSGVPPYTQHDAMGWHGKAIATGRAQRFNWQCKSKDGHLFWAEVSLRFASIGGQDVVLATVRDITERQTIEAQLRQAQKMEAIGNLTGGMAHDFNNLLGVIVGNLGLARDQLAADQETHELVGEALEAAWHGADLTRRLLAFARRQPLRPGRIDLNELVGNTVRLLRRLLGEDIDISLDLAEHVWPITADSAQLEASLTNLATNARDAMPKGGRLIITTDNRQLDADYATLHADVTPGDFAMIEISDTGSGMAAETMNQIFEPFFTTKEPGKGTGLGLSMVFGFLRQSGGHVNVYSELGVGTTFRLYLPRVAEAAEREVADAPAAERGAGETVLVVEDNPAVRRILLRQLREIGYHILECDRAAAALEILQREPVDLLLTDIVMPGGLDGVELGRLALERWPTLKIVLTSGFPQARVNGNGDVLGNFRLLSKPYSKEELSTVLRDALGLAN